ncbi:MAG TPA: uracil-DNA glycosylase [Geminicoccaceae bacterium]|nr:uracil-DNA glycosylase [Geminicoccaceae bacterium]
MAAPGRDCPLCPRLVACRGALRQSRPDWFNAPVPSFGDAEARLLVVGLAPGVAGANRTGRPFTGDHAGEVLYPALLHHGFARGTFRARPDDGLELVGCRITNAVRCVPPQNRPTGQEIVTCRQFLVDELAAGTVPEVVLALGRIAYDSVLRALGQVPSHWPFAHGVVHALPDGPVLAASYHTSRYNMNTGRLTEAMFDSVLARVAGLLQARAA